MKKIDSHHHFWKYSPSAYPWIDAPKQVLKRDYLPPDLKAETTQAGITGVISVQARQSVEETNWLLELAETNDFIHGVVGWAPLASSDLRRSLDSWRGRSKLLGVRHVLQDEPDDRHMCRPDFDAGIGLLKEYGLRYDILIFERQLPGSIELVDRHPNQVFIIDHIAKPQIAAAHVEPWKSRMIEIARRPNVYCKISGMATEADWKHWTPDQLRRYFDATLEAFGPSRLMFGSDWPVALLACGYKKWVDLVAEWIQPLSSSEQERIWSGTAKEAYGLK